MFRVRFLLPIIVNKDDCDENWDGRVEICVVGFVE